MPVRVVCALTAIAGALLLAASCASTPPSAARDVAAAAAYRWLERQQDPSGLLAVCESNYLGADLQANALAAICFLQHGDPARAERVLAFFDKQYAAEFRAVPGGFHQLWNPGDGTAYQHSSRPAAGNAWLLIALNRYRQITGSRRYDATARGIARWLISLQDPDGGIVSGFNRGERMSVKSTAANLVCSAALAGYSASRAAIGRWLADRMWIAPEQRFRADTTTTQSSAEALAFAVLALGREFNGALGCAEPRLLRGDRMSVNGSSVVGFADMEGSPCVSFEATAQMALAYRLAGSPQPARRYLDEMRRALLPSPRFPDAAGFPATASRPSWDGASSRIYVPAQAWFLLSVQGINPLEVPSDKAGKNTPP